MSSYFSRAQALFEYTRDLRRDFHCHPELGFQEYRTSKVIVRELEKLPGIRVQTGFGGTGVVGLLEGNQPGRVVLVRFDMDALPITEQTDLPFASEHPGLMHACGHDGHMAIGLTTARILSEDLDNLAGTVKFVFQPAEEGLGGAKKIIEDHVLENPRPDLALALHLWNEKPLGWMAISDGPLMSASDRFDLHLVGKGGHGAKPQDAVDPVVAAAAILTAFQSIISRELDPLEGGVITTSTLRAGEAHNIIPDEAFLSGTVRSFTPSVRALLLERISEVATAVAAAYRCQADLQITETSPAVVNHPDVARHLREVARELYPEMEITDAYRTMVSEDMALLMQEISGCYCLVGSANPEKGFTAGHHHPEFSFDEQAMIYGASLLAAAAASLLQK